MRGGESGFRARSAADGYVPRRNARERGHLEAEGDVAETARWREGLRVEARRDLAPIDERNPRNWRKTRPTQTRLDSLGKDRRREKVMRSRLRSQESGSRREERELD